jgi:MYXO-CTERM domain-containing protein
MHRQKLLIAAALAAVACPLTVLASDQPGSAVDQWFEETAVPNGTTYFGYNIFSSNGFYSEAGESLAHANMTRGAGALNKIGGADLGGLNASKHGELNNNADVDIFCITITNPAAFSATASAGDHNLYLFKADGTSVIGYQYLNVGPSPATIPVGNGAVLAAFNAGDTAYIAITRDDTATVYNHPMNNAFQEIYSSTASGLVTPLASVSDKHLGTTEGDINVPGNWTDSTSDAAQLFANTYNITFTGAGYSVTPAPGAAGLLGLGGLVALRRRRS